MVHHLAEDQALDSRRAGLRVAVLGDPSPLDVRCEGQAEANRNAVLVWMLFPDHLRVALRPRGVSMTFGFSRVPVSGIGPDLEADLLGQFVSDGVRPRLA